MRVASVTILLFSAWHAGSAAGQSAPPQRNSSYAAPHNFYGAHLLVDDGKPGTRGDKHLRWARHLVGRRGFAKTLFANLDRNRGTTPQGWIDYVNRCYELELIPLLRLGGRFESGRWMKPEADHPGDYSSLARAVAGVVAGLPRSNLCPLYIEIWNEPNLDVEWSGRSDPAEYAAFCVQVAAAIRQIGDERIKILNGGLATSPDWARRLCEANPEYVRCFDYYSVHPYPQNRPPSFNHHDKRVPPDSGLTIDSYLLELAELAKFGRPDVKVVLSETGYDLGNGVFTQAEGHPIMDEYNRADYIVRAFRDYWSKWPEVFAVTPFEFCNEGWERFDWVYPDSGTRPDGSPTRPHYQYTCVADLAKPTDSTGAISGTVYVKGLGTRVPGATVALTSQQFTSDPMGNYFLARLRPGAYGVTVTHPSFKPVRSQLTVAAGRNTVFDAELEATRRVTLSGLVRSGDTGRALAGVLVQLAPGDQKAITDSAGRFRVPECVPTRYTLNATHDGHHPYRSSVEIAGDKLNRHDFYLGEQRTPATGNMLNNPGMEAGGGGSAKEGIALGMELTDPGAYGVGTMDVTGRQAHTGRLSQAMAVRPQETLLRQITHYGTAKPGTTYLAAAWVRLDAPGRNSAAWISLDATDNGGGLIRRTAAEPGVAGRTRGWIYLSVEGEAPPGSQRLSINLHTQGAGGFAYFDDLYLGPAAPN